MATHVLNADRGQWWNLEQLQHLGSKAAWVSNDSGIWWKLRFLAEAFQPVEKKNTYFNSFKWLKDVFEKQVEKSKEFVTAQLRNCNVNRENSTPIYLWTNSDGNHLQEHVTQTSGLLHFLFQYGEVCRASNVFESILERMKTLGASVLEFSLHLQEQFVFEHLQSASGTNISGGQIVNGVFQSLLKRFNLVLPTVKNIWSELKTEQQIQADFPTSAESSVGFIDLLMFTFWALRWRTKQGKSKAASLLQLIGLLRADFISILSMCLNSYIERNVMNDPRFAISRNLPAIRRKSTDERPVRVEVDSETIWALMESATLSGMSLRQALLLKKNDSMSSPDLAGASERKAEYWEKKITSLYMNRVQNVFRMTTQLSIVADASTHSGKEILISCAYAPTENLGCHCVIQHLNTGSLKPSEVDVSTLARIAKNRKLQRMSAFRQLQAIDNQLALLSGNRLGLDAFSLKNVEDQKNEEEEDEQKKKKSKRKGKLEGRFSTGVDLAGRVVDQSTNKSESGSLAERVVDQVPHSVQMSKLYTSHNGIVDVNEVRAWETNSEGICFEVVRNQNNNISAAILPQKEHWWRSVPILVLSLDQGPIGTAGMAFALQGHRIHVRFDKIHRCIRDYKLALGRALGGIFLKTQLHSSYIFGLNYKPFNTGLFHEQKKTMLESFLESQNIDGDLWQEFRERIAFDAGETVVNDIRLFESLSELPSFKKKGTLIKPARWFSWNQCCEEFLPEFHTLKMLAKYEFQDSIRPLDEIDEDQKPEAGALTVSLGNKIKPESKQSAKDDEHILRSLEKMKKSFDPREELRVLKKLCGGFKLAYKLMTEELYDNSKLLACITRPLWDWYTNQITNCKSPQDALKHIQEMTSTWMKDRHVQEIIALMGQPEEFRWCQHRGTVHVEKKVSSMIFHLVSLRLWSNSKYSYPPDCYSLLLSDDADVRSEIALKMKNDYECLLDFEHLLVQHVVPPLHPHVKLLHKHILIILTVPTRLLLDSFRQFGFRLNTPGEEAAKQILKVLCATFADNKIVEDLHGNVRNEARSKISKKMSYNTIQSVVGNSSVLETRKIRHPAKLTKKLFVRDWKNPKKRLSTELPRMQEAGRHKMGKHWHHVMGPKRWGTISETTLEQGAAAWRWFQHHASGMCESDVKLEDAYFSKFAVAHEIFTKNKNDENSDAEEKEYFLCLGHSTWACLMWPLTRIAGESENYFFLLPLESARWEHICKPLEWNVVPSVPAFYNEFIGLKQTEEECSLPCFYFLHQKHFGCINEGIVFLFFF